MGLTEFTMSGKIPLERVTVRLQRPTACTDLLGLSLHFALGFCS